MPIPLVPMEPVAATEIDQSGACLFQVKWDGFRLFVDKTDTAITLWTRRGKDITASFPEIVQALQPVVGRVWLDGELVALGPDGRPDFHRLLTRSRSKRPRTDVPVMLMLFDCLQVDGRLLVSAPIEERQAELDQRVDGGGLIAKCDSFDDGDALFARMQALEMEGIVAKRRGSLYLPGVKSPLWQKIKYWQTQRVHAAAVRMRDGRPASVQMTLADDPAVVVGSVSSGLSDEALWALYRLAAKPAAGGSELLPLPAGIWMDVRFLEWTPGGQMRSPTVLSVGVK